MTSQASQREPSRAVTFVIMVVCAWLAVLVGVCGAQAQMSARPALMPPMRSHADLVLIPAGTVQIGDDAGPPDEGPAFRYTSRPFLMQRSPVTVGQFAAFVHATGYKTDAERDGTGGVLDQRQGAWVALSGANWRHPLGPRNPAARPDHPVTQVSWYDAVAFCRAHGLRLPTELEWERAARMGQTPDGHVFAIGDPIELSERYRINAWEGVFPLLNTGADGYLETSPVGAFGTAPSGLTDMAGNVWEWTSSWYVPYGSQGSPPGDAERVSRGGSFLCSPSFCEGYRASARNHTTPDTSLENIGFRCAADAGVASRASPGGASNPARGANFVGAGRVAIDGVKAPTASASAPRPNVIMILADDLGYADISAYKIDRFQTPNIDRIGLQGVRFTDGYATAPVCAPSRAGLMTGRYQERFGFEYNDGPAKRNLAEGLGLAVGEVTLAQLLKASGYHTGMVGKWHLGSQPQFYPMNRGFDEFVGFLPGEISYMDPDQPGVHVSFGPLGDSAAKAGRIAPNNDPERAGREPPAMGQREMTQPPTSQPGRQPTIGQPRMGQRIADTFRRGGANQIIEGADRHVVHNEGEYLTDYFADRATDFIRRGSQSGQPYFLYLAFNAVHSPHMVTAKYYDRFPQIKNHQQRVYAAMIAALDDAVGRVLDAVDASGQAGNTLIYFASDNGCAMYWPGLCSCTPLRGGKLSHYEGGVRVPFMMRWPARIKPGLVYRNVVSLLDVLPTSVAAAGGKLPTDRIYDGVDLAPYLTGHKTGDPHNMLAWRRLPLFSIREGDWKLWESVDDKTGKYGEYKLLFNLKDDLNETTNLADRYPRKVRELERHVHEWAHGMMDPQWPSKPPKSFSVCGTPFVLPI